MSFAVNFYVMAHTVNSILDQLLVTYTRNFYITPGRRQYATVKNTLNLKRILITSVVAMVTLPIVTRSLADYAHTCICAFVCTTATYPPGVYTIVLLFN
jgi:hypothetical protein